MIKKIALLLFLLLFESWSTPKKSEITIQQKKESLETFNKQKLKVYTTAKHTSLILSLTDETIFGKSNQPKETEIAVFVNPNNTYSLIVGDGKVSLEIEPHAMQYKQY